jgi:phosphoglucosamine mutase
MALFGTDGIRGRFGEFLTTELAERVAFAAGLLIPAHSRVLIGRDTRSSGLALEAALSAGFVKGGHEVIQVGVIPTPGLAYLTLEPGNALGVMITASHNPAADNGIKIFGHNGMKIADEMESQIESWVASSKALTSSQSGAILEDHEGVERYVTHLKSSISTSLTGLKVVVDCANGAAAFLAPRILRELGADVSEIATSPDGTNINAGVGSTHLDPLRAKVREVNADLGIAHDGDADRALMVDRHGRVIDGDCILFALATAISSSGALKKKTVVTTVMTNLGFHREISKFGIKVEVTNVGDRYVLERMNEEGLSLGGEQSGHIIVSALATTGDGILTALLTLELVKKAIVDSDSFAEIFPRYPQLLENIRVKDKESAMKDVEILAAISQVEANLGEHGRILVRSSGTEDLVRVMAEADTMERAQEAVESLAGLVKARHGA